MVFYVSKNNNNFPIKTIIPQISFRCIITLILLPACDPCKKMKNYLNSGATPNMVLSYKTPCYMLRNWADLIILVYQFWVLRIYRYFGRYGHFMYRIP